MSASAIGQSKPESTALTTSLTQGVVAGLIGGSIFGGMMAAMNMLPLVGSMLGSQSPVVGFIVHMFISAVGGGIYGVIAPRLPTDWLAALVAGVVYGIVWWVLGALIIMPLVLGMSQMVLQIGDPQWMSLIGHIIFGIVTAAFYMVITQRP